MTGEASAADGSLERLRVARGAAAALLLAAPAALVNVVLAAQDPKPVSGLNATLLAMVLGFAAGGFLAGGEALSRRGPLHGAAAGAAAWVPVQAIGLLGRADRGDGLSIGSMILLLMLAVGAGAFGGRLGAARRRVVLAKEESG